MEKDVCYIEGHDYGAVYWIYPVNVIVEHGFCLCRGYTHHGDGTINIIKPALKAMEYAFRQVLFIF